MMRTILSVVLAACLGACATTRGPQSSSPDDSQARLAEAHQHVMAAQAAHAGGNIDGAIAGYTKAVTAYRDYPAAWYNLGVLLQQQKKYADAAEALNAAAELDAKDPRALTALGLQAQEMGWYEDALRFYDRALERNPNYLPALKKAVEAGQYLDRYDDAMLGRCKRALLLESDQQWVDYLKRMFLKAQDRVSRSGGMGNSGGAGIPGGTAGR